MVKRRLDIKRREVARVSKDEVEQMWVLFKSLYEGVSKSVFLNDLYDKTRVITLHENKTDRVLGFSTLAFSKVEYENTESWILFSGDTALHRDAWGDRSLTTAFLYEVLRFRLRHPFTKFHWLLISKGYKTYLLLTRNFPTHWPRHDAQTPPSVQALLRAALAERFADKPVQKAKCILLPAEHGSLKNDVAPITQDMMLNPDIAFFAKQNPDYKDGCELCCLGKVNVSMFVRLISKALRGRRKNKSSFDTVKESSFRAPVVLEQNVRDAQKRKQNA